MSYINISESPLPDMKGDRPMAESRYEKYVVRKPAIVTSTYRMKYRKLMKFR